MDAMLFEVVGEPVGWIRFETTYEIDVDELKEFDSEVEPDGREDRQGT